MPHPRRIVRRKIDRAPAEIGMLVENHADQSDGRRLRDRVWVADRGRPAERSASPSRGAASWRAESDSSAWVKMEQRVEIDGAISSIAHRDSKDKRSAPAGNPSQASISFCQSSGASGRSVERSSPSNSKTSPCLTTGTERPISRNRETNASLSPRRPRKRATIFPPAVLYPAICNRSFFSRLARQQTDLAFAAGRTNQAGQRSRLSKAGFPQHRFPLRSLAATAVLDADRDQ